MDVSNGHTPEVEGKADAQVSDLYRVAIADSTTPKPTYPSEDGEAKELDLNKELSIAELQLILQQALRTEQQDAEALLSSVRSRFDRVGLELPTIEVRFDDLFIETELFAETGRNRPNILNAYRDIFEWVFLKVGLLRPRKVKLVILNKVSSVLKPGRTTLLLGPPAAGKSTLLKALGNKLGSSGLKVEGEVTYNGHTFDEFIPQRTAMYVEQEDMHMPELTVRETFNFSARCQGVGSKADELAELRRREQQAGITPDKRTDTFMGIDALKNAKHSIATEYAIRMLGLGICSDTLVGNQMIRGISGGQKKRVTTGEIIVGPKRVYFMDEISTGLDSSTTYEIVKFLRDTTHALNYTMLIALLQPAPETYDLFDDILLLSEGFLVYHGPRDLVMTFFEGLGFQCPERKGIADFLQEVTSRKDQKQYWADSLTPHRYISVADFAERFQAFKAAHPRLQALHDVAAKPLDASEDGGAPAKPAANDAAPQGLTGRGRVRGDAGPLVKTKYALSGMELFWVCWERELTLVSRNLFIYGFRFFVTMFMGVVTATLFLRTQLHPNSISQGNLYFGAMFFSLIMVMFDGFAENPLTIQRLAGWYKQRDQYFYPAWAYVFPTTVLRLPYSATVAIFWSIIVYYPIGLAPEPGRFFAFMLLLFLLHSMGISMFRFQGSLCRNETITSCAGPLFFLVLLLLGGFLLPYNDIPKWWIWFYWIDPVSYAQQGIAVNEFLAPRWATFDDANGVPAGISLLQSHGVHLHHYWLWLGVAATFAANVVFNLGCWLCHATLDSLEKPAVMLRPEEVEEEDIAPVGHVPATPKSPTSPLAGDVEMASVPPTNGHASPGTNDSQKSIGLARTSVDAMPRSRRNMDAPGASARGMNLTQLLESRRAISANGGAAAVPDSRRSLGRDSMGSASEVQPAGDKGMVLPFTPLSLAFHDLNYYVDMPKEMVADEAAVLARGAQVEGKTMLQLLRGCSGAFRPGILTALVGSSGAGKTTLMDVLAGRKTTGIITGDVRVSGFPKVQETFARVIGYVEQNDIHSPQITVHESLVYSARLRFTPDIELAIVYAFVEEVMDLVELQPLRDSIVGKPGFSGLSVEQRKRLTIAVELVANPSIVFMDEPTSGLDARAAAIVMRTVRNTVNTGRTVVCTIHQPSIDIFEAFDDLLLMKYGGSVTYHGHLGQRSRRLIEYFEAVPGVPKLVQGLNPATWMLQISTPGMEATIGVDFAETYQNSELFRRNEKLIEELSVPPEGSEPLHFATKYPQSTWGQFRLCFWKFWRSYWQDPGYNATRFFFAGFLALLVGSILWQVAKHKTTSQDVANILGALYLAMLFLGIINSFTVQPPAAYERSVMYRERAAGMYGELPFALAQCAVELPYNMVQTILFCAISYFMMGFDNDAGNFFWYIFVIFLTLNLMAFYGIMGVYITPDLPVASVLSGFFYGFWNLFAGFIIPVSSMAGWWKWYYYVNPIAWTLYGIIVTQLGNDETVITVVGTDEMKTIKQYLADGLNYHYSFIGPVIAILLSFTIFFAGLAILSLKYMKFQKR